MGKRGEFKIYCQLLSIFVVLLHIIIGNIFDYLYNNFYSYYINLNRPILLVFKMVKIIGITVTFIDVTKFHKNVS